jgi:hypothetical protein
VEENNFCLAFQYSVTAILLCASFRYAKNIKSVILLFKNL